MKKLLLSLCLLAALGAAAGCEGGDPSDPSLCSTDLSAPSLTAPSDGSTSVSPGFVTFDWGDVTNASSYSIVIYDGAGCTGSTVESGNPTASGYTSTTSLSASTTYSWDVQALGSGDYCDSPVSSCFDFTTTP
jgi:hypothetical protein